MARKKTQDKTAGGKPITDDLIGKLADRAEDGYDVEETLCRRRDLEATSSVIRGASPVSASWPDERCGR